MGLLKNQGRESAHGLPNSVRLNASLGTAPMPRTSTLELIRILFSWLFSKLFLKKPKFQTIHNSDDGFSPLRAPQGNKVVRKDKSERLGLARYRRGIRTANSPHRDD